VLPDGSWSAAGARVSHPASLLYLKSHLVVDERGAFVADERSRVPIVLDGPPLVVLGLRADPERGELCAVLDDGRVETVRDGTLRMDEATGRFEYLARGGTTRALLSRAAHQGLIDWAEEEAGEFFLRVGTARFAIRT
jgi:hypothetical protein